MSVHKLHPRLRVIANSGEDVNAFRATWSTLVASVHDPESGPTAEASDERRATQATARQAARGQTPPDLIRPRRPARKRPTLTEAGVAEKAFVNIVVETERSGLNQGEQVQSVLEELRTLSRDIPPETGAAVAPRRNLIAATVCVRDLERVAALPGVSFVHSAEGLRFSPPIRNSAGSTPPSSRAPRPRLTTEMRDARVRPLVGIIDVGGFDFSHPDFLDANGETRFLRIWDQGGDFRNPPNGYDFGAEFTRDQLNAAIRTGAQQGWPPYLVERQSYQEPGSHATHVASIAAGNRGVCPDSDIIGVTISIPQEGDEFEERRRTFSDSSRIALAVDYLLDIADEMRRPIAINISLGTNGGSHDAANGISRWLDSALATPGRTICVAAGNAGQESGETDDDIGWIMGRIHTSGQIAARGLDLDLEWVVVGNGIADYSENEMEIWFSAQDRLVVSVQPPGSMKWYEVRPCEFIQNLALPNGTYLSIYNELYYPTNGANYIAIYLTPRWNAEDYSPVAPGVWKVRLHGEEIRDGHFHAWIERDDPFEIERRNGSRAFHFPSFFSETSNVDTHSLSSLACTHRVVAVANLDEERQRINVTSSQGPTRDDRFKPDIAAPGTNILAANGFDDGTKPWVSMSGTSMASPYVTGVLATMLSVKPQLTAAQCLGILQRTARPLPSHSYDWRNDAGFGRIAPVEAIEEVASFDQRKEIEG